MVLSPVQPADQGLVVRHTFLELESDRLAPSVRPRAMTDSIVEYSIAEELLKVKESRLDSATTADGSWGSSVGSWADCDSPRSSRASERFAEQAHGTDVSTASFGDSSSSCGRQHCDSLVKFSEADTGRAPSGQSWRSHKVQSRLRAPTQCVGTASLSRREAPLCLEPVEDDGRTTLLLKGFPVNFSRAQLLEMLNAEGFHGLFNFVYMPVDLLSWANYGFAFVNFTSTEAANRALNEFTHYSINQGQDLVEASYSEKDQGLEALVERHRNNPLMHKDMPEEYRPLLLEDGVAAEFPPPTKKIRLQSLMQQLRRRQRRDEQA